MNMKSFTKKPFVLITGAAVRIGRAMVLDLSNKGYIVGIHYWQSQKAAVSLFDEVISKGGDAFLFQADLTKPDQIQTMFDEILAKKLNLTVVINSAAIMPEKHIDVSSVEEWDQIFNLNLRAIWLISKNARLILKNNNGCIINFSESGVNKTWLNHPVYLISKTALNKLSQILAKEFAPEVRVNTIALGLVLKSNDMEVEDWQRMVEKTPLGRPVELEDLLHAVHFCINNCSMTGEIITLDCWYQLI